jgi:hypothetical protein
LTILSESFQMPPALAREERDRFKIPGNTFVQRDRVFALVPSGVIGCAGRAARLGETFDGRGQLNQQPGQLDQETDEGRRFQRR